MILKGLKDDTMEFRCISSCSDTSSSPKLIASIFITENLLPSAYVYLPVTNPQTTKICAQVPGRNSRVFPPSSNTTTKKNFFIAGTE